LEVSNRWKCNAADAVHIVVRVSFVVIATETAVKASATATATACKTKADAAAAVVGVYAFRFNRQAPHTPLQRFFVATPVVVVI
jgi:hypothetical protein